MPVQTATTNHTSPPKTPSTNHPMPPQTISSTPLNGPPTPRSDPPATPGFPDGRWAAEVTAEIRSLQDRFTHLEQTLLTTLQHLADQHAAHLAYHRDQEHRWGLLRLIQRHPARVTALILVLLALTLGRTDLDPAALRHLITLFATGP